MELSLATTEDLYHSGIHVAKSPPNLGWGTVSVLIFALRE